MVAIQNLMKINNVSKSESSRSTCMGIYNVLFGFFSLQMSFTWYISLRKICIKENSSIYESLICLIFKEH